MASPVLALSRFTNLDQESAPEYATQLTVSTHGSGADSADVQPLPLGIPEDTVTLSSARTQPNSYSTPAATPAPSLSAAASYLPVRAKENISPDLNTRNARSTQSSTNSIGDSTTSSLSKAPPKPAPPPRESEASQDDPYQATNQTTQQSLLQLDRTLEQIGVDPQHTSLVRRVALVRLANDPPALGEYFGPASSVAASTTNSSSPASSPAPEPSDSKVTPDVPKASTDTSHRSFVPQGKLLNVSV
jgi:hypothetical protein